ncbi:hypothetical protein PanWU01x14_370800, partial [Parasponia andersonii]
AELEAESVGNESWSRDESNGGSGAVIGRRTAERRAKNRSAGGGFGLRFLRREAMVYGGSTRRWFVGVFRSRRVGASGTAAAGRALGEQ